MPLEEVLERFDEFAADNDHFEFYWFPYGSNALVKRNNRRSPADAGSRFRRRCRAGGGSSSTR